jgi:hypothetical protein
MYPQSQISARVIRDSPGVFRRRLADAAYLWKYSVISIRNWFDFYAGKVQTMPATKNAFHSFFPTLLNEDRFEEKYSSLVEDDGEFVVSVLTDGMHQNIELRKYWVLRQRAIASGYYLIDQFFALGHVVFGLWWSFKVSALLLQKQFRRLYFRDLLVGEMIRKEMLVSSSRVVRLMTLRRAYAAFFDANQHIEKLYYYPLEYPYGRMITYALKTGGRNIRGCGYQMGPVTHKRLEQWLGVKEAMNGGISSGHLLIPDEILAEDKGSKRVYESVGYKNVNLMKSIFRLDYLNNIVSGVDSTLELVALGLHDTTNVFSSAQ